MRATQAQIEKSILQKNEGEVFVSSEFQDQYPRTAVDKAFSRLTEKGVIRRLAPGIYDIPKQGKFVKRSLPPEPEKIALAWAKKNNARLLPDGVFAANALQLSDQMSGGYIYLTDKASASLDIQGLRIQFKRTTLKYMKLSGCITGIVVQALRSLGRVALESDSEYALSTINKLNAILSHSDKLQIKKDIKDIPKWMQPLLSQLTLTMLS